MFNLLDRATKEISCLPCSKNSKSDARDFLFYFLTYFYVLAAWLRYMEDYAYDLTVGSYLLVIF